MKRFISFLLIFLVFLASFGLSVNALTPDATLIITNPGADMSKEVNVSWHTEIDGTVVKYTVATDTSYSKAQVVTGQCSPVPFEEKTTTKQCKATLSGLSSSTDYIYQVGKTNMSESYRFRTAGDETFSFFHITDIHAYTPLPGRVNLANDVLNQAQTVDSGLDFILATGDVTAYGTVYEYWDSLYKMDTAKKMMYTFTPGNHDYYNRSASVTNISYWNAVTNNPNNGADSVKGSSYFFKYGNTLFISIDSEAAYHNKDLYLPDQKAWMKKVIEENPSEFIVMYDHKPFYTGNGTSGTQTKFMIDNFGPIIDEFGVDLVLTGDNHILARSHPMYNKQITTGAGNGTIYMVGPQTGDRSVAAGTVPNYIAFTEGGKVDGGTLVTISENKMILKTIDVNGNELSTYEIASKSSTIDKTALTNSLALTVDTNDFTKATLNFNQVEPGRIRKIKIIGEQGEELQTFLNPATNTLQINNTTSNVADFDVNVEAIFRNGEKVTKQFTLVNNNYFGVIENVVLDETADLKLKWDSNIVSGKVDKIEIYVNDVKNATVTSDLKEAVLNKVSPYHVNVIVLKAISPDNRVLYTQTLNYGEEAEPVFIVYDYPTANMKAGEKFKPTYSIVPDQQLELEFTSSDESIATVDANGEVTALKAGKVTISVNVKKRWDVNSSIEITIAEADPVPEEPKGCFSKSNAIVVLSLLGIIIIFRKRRIF